MVDDTMRKERELTARLVRRTYRLAAFDDCRVGHGHMDVEDQ